MFFRPAPLILFALCLASCQRSSQRPSERIGVVVFENLTSDRDLEWIGHAIADIVAAQSAGSAQTRIIVRRTLADAQTVRMTKTLHGYFTGDSRNLQLRATLYEEGSRQTAWSLTESGSAGDLLRIADAIARRLSPHVQPYTTSSEIAMREFYRAEVAATSADALTSLDSAIAADPRFGSAQLQKLELLVHSDRTQAAAALEHLKDLNLRPYEQARLALLRAELTGDESARLAALTRMAELQDISVELWQSIAEAQITAGQYEAAAEACARGLALEPDHEALLNTKGYALAFAGDSSGAVEALTQYKRLYPQSANASDSLGEVHFYFGRYEDASRAFLEAARQDPALIGGAEPFRAAFALYLSGDVSGADKVFNAYVEDLRQRRDPQAELKLRIWHRLTGRPVEAAAQNSLIQSTLALWALADGDRARAQKLAQSAAASAESSEARNAANTSAFLAQPAASFDVWNSRVASVIRGPEQSDARERLLGWALLLDRRYGEAAKVWQSIQTRSPGLARTDEKLALVWALASNGQINEARRIMPHGSMPPSALIPGLNMLLYERLPAIQRILKTGTPAG